MTFLGENYDRRWKCNIVGALNKLLKMPKPGGKLQVQKVWAQLLPTFLSKLEHDANHIVHLNVGHNIGHLVHLHISQLSHQRAFHVFLVESVAQVGLLQSFNPKVWRTFLLTEGLTAS